MVKKLLLAGFVLALVCAPTLLFSADLFVVVPAGCTGDDGICHCSESGKCKQTPSCQDDTQSLCVIGNFSQCACTYFEEPPVIEDPPVIEEPPVVIGG